MTKTASPISSSHQTRKRSTGTERIVHELDFATQGAGIFAYRRFSGKHLEDEVRASFSVNDLDFAQGDERLLDPLDADLRDVVVELHFADRLAVRHPKGHRDSAGKWWARHIRVCLPVRHPDRWNDIPVKRTLEKYLFTNTGDRWELEFVRSLHDEPLDANLPIENLGRGHLWGKTPKQIIVALWSGGVDSTGGLAHQAREFPDADFVLVSVGTNAATNARQDLLVKGLPASVRNRVRRISIGLQLHDAQKLADASSKRGAEKSLRTRGLLFLSAGALVARRMGQSRLYVYENGLGALNLSFDRAQVRGQANRAVHPLSLALFGQFITALFRSPMVIDNPFLFSTKAALCHALDTSGGRKLIPLTFTCGHPQRIKGKGVWHCGVCTSCLLRRQGFRAANMSREDTAQYVFDPKDFMVSSEVELPVHQDKCGEWLKVGSQFRSIQRAIAGAPQAEYEAIWNRLRERFPELRDLEDRSDIAVNGHALSRAELRFGLVKLLLAYEAEGVVFTAKPLQIVARSNQVSIPLSLFGEKAA